MAERFEIRKYAGTANIYTQRRSDRGHFIWDYQKDCQVIGNITKSQAEQVKKALDEATKEVGHE